jgi:hypothetical protein
MRPAESGGRGWVGCNVVLLGCGLAGSTRKAGIVRVGIGWTSLAIYRYLQAGTMSCGSVRGRHREPHAAFRRIDRRGCGRLSPACRTADDKTRESRPLRAWIWFIVCGCVPNCILCRFV